jgi:hypothetical protein
MLQPPYGRAEVGRHGLNHWFGLVVTRSPAGGA